jgi:hypothetical protein
MNLFYGKEKSSYLEWRLLVHGSEFPSLLVPCSKPTTPFEAPPSIALLPIALFPGNTEFFLHSDYINKPDPSSVGHSFHIHVYELERLLFFQRYGIA